MQHGIVHLAAAPLRAEPSDRSEMVSQLLFGESVVVLERQPKWVRVRSAFDDYEGWMDVKQFMPLEADGQHHQQKHTAVVTDALALAEHNGTMVMLPMGSSLPRLRDNVFTLGDRAYTFHGNALHGKQTVTSELIQTTALRLLNTPYMWGGRTAMGLDCSGFTQVVFKAMGMPLKRDASQQCEQGTSVSFPDAQAGDLAFFQNSAGKIVHVGILLDAHTIVHASGCVRIDRFEERGIYNVGKKTVTHSLNIIKRLL